jgi:predicted dehydrogenase
MLTYVAGPPRRVFCRTTTRVNDIEVEDCAAASLELADGSLATVSATLGSPQEVTRHRFHFEGFSAESGTAPYTSSGLPWTITPDTPEASTAIEAVVGDWVERAEEWQGQFERWADSLDAGTDPPVTLADARASLELLTALYWSARTGEDVVLPLDASHPYYGGWLP